MIAPAIHYCRICGSETVAHQITGRDGNVVVSHRCYCGFIEPVSNSRSGASAVRKDASSPDSCAVSDGSASFRDEEQSGLRPGVRTC